MKLKTQGLPAPLYTSVEALYNNLFTGAPVILRKTLSAGLVVLALMACASVSNAQQTPGPGAKPATVMSDVIQVPTAAQPSEHFDADAATNAYLAEIPASARARSDAYFEGGYWLILWDFLYGAAVYLFCSILAGPQQ